MAVKDLTFFPSKLNAKVIDARMRAILGESIEHILQQADGMFELDPKPLLDLAHGLSEGLRYSPAVFGLYAELVFAIQAEDYAQVIDICGLLESERPLDSGWQVTSLGDGPEYRERLFCRFMDTDPNTRFSIFPPSPEITDGFKSRLHEGLALMEQALPDLAAEIEQLVSQVILVVGDTAAKYQFDGGSSYMLWGGLFLNASSHETPVAIVEVLAHESAHLLLFGFASDEPLVLNHDAELYPSPLRLDPRPMDGIYHSTYVSARMHWAMSELLASSLLDFDGQVLARNAMESDFKNFGDGYAVVEQYGDLTDTGKAVMASAKAYMDSVSNRIF